MLMLECFVKGFPAIRLMSSLEVCMKSENAADKLWNKSLLLWTKLLVLYIPAISQVKCVIGSIVLSLLFEEI